MFDWSILSRGIISRALPHCRMHILFRQEALLPHKGDLIATYSRWQCKRVKPLSSCVNGKRIRIL